MPKRLPTLRQMQILLALAEHKNISRVAAVLHISQPSVSIQLKNLTEVFDSPLYHVNGRRLEFTEAGIAAVNTAQEMFFALDKLHMELEDLKGAKAGVLKLAVVSTAKYFLPILLGPFCKRYPLIDVQLDIGNREKIIQRFNQNKDDYYIFSQYPKADNLVAEPFIENPLVVVAPVNHELTKKMPISLNRLSHYPFLLREHGSGTRQTIEDFCQQHHVSLKAKMTIESNQAIKHSVAAGLGLAILSSHTLDYMQDDNLVKLDVEHFPIKSQWYLVRNKKRHQTILAELFYQYLQEEGLDKLKTIAKNQRSF